jgi:hypothetical protein
VPEQTDHAEAPRRRPWRPIYFAPIAALAALAVVLAWGLTRDPGVIPTPLINSLKQSQPQASRPSDPQFSLAQNRPGDDQPTEMEKRK